MKILQVCPYNFSRPGGVKTHILGLTDALRSNGHDVKIVVPNQSTSLTGDSGIYSFGRNVSLPSGGTKIDLNICVGKEWRKLKKFIKEENFDVVHYHTIWNPLLPFQVRIIFRGHQVATFHDTPSKTTVGRFLGSWVMPILARIIFYWLDQIISVSETQKKCISRFSKRNIHIISNGISPLKQGKKIQEYLDGKFNVLFLGRLEPRKGIMDAIRAFEKFVDQVPKSRLIVAGEGREGDEAQRYCTLHKLGQVKFIGLVTEEMKQNLLLTSNLFVASALYGESFGIVLLEAMQAGVPLVGYANDGYKELLTKEQLEYFAEPGNISGLSSAMVKIHSTNTNDLLRIGKSHASDFEWAGLVSIVEELYQQSFRTRSQKAD